MRAALVNSVDGMVVNVIEYDVGVEFIPPDGFLLVESDLATIGSHWDGVIFTPPPPEIPVSPPSVEQLLAITLVAKSTVKAQVMASTLPETQIKDVSVLFPSWQVGIAVSIGDIYNYNGTIVKCVQAHTTQADWTPDVTPALWTVYHDPTVPTPWVQPTGAQDAYPLGALVTHNGLTWSSNVAANVWEPPTQWTQVV